MFKLKSLLVGLVFGLAGMAIANVTPLSSFTGPQDPSQIQAYLNTLINALNAQITNYIQFGTGTESGEMQISGNGNTWAANGTIATSVTSLGPQGAHTTVQEWLVVFDTNGFLRFIPAF